MSTKSKALARKGPSWSMGKEKIQPKKQGAKSKIRVTETNTKATVRRPKKAPSGY